MFRTLGLLLIDEIKFWLSFWYFGWPKSFLRSLADFLTDLDRKFSFRAHWRNFFVPLYGQKDIVSLLISITYRTFLLFFGFLLLLSISGLWLLILIFWLSLPIYLILLLFLGNAVPF